MGVIYKIVNPKGKIYIGKTYNLKKRIACHKCASKKGTNIILHNSIKKYGWENHLLEVIETVEDIFLNEREMFWIVTLKTYSYENKMGMNMTLGGDGQRSTWMHDIERRKKMSQRFSGNNNHFFGKHHSEENKNNLSIKAKERNLKDGRRIPEWGVEKMLELCRKPVVAYNYKGTFIGEFISVSQAAKKLSLERKNISSVLCKKQVSTGGIVFIYKEGKYPKFLKMAGIKIKKCNRAILRLDRKMNIIKEYISAKEASLELQIPKGSVSRAANDYNYKPLRTGEIFKYKDEHILNSNKN